MTIPDFISRCDLYCQAAAVTRVWLSKRLLNDTYRLGQLAAGEVDIGVKRLARAAADLSELERLLATPANGDPANGKAA